MTNSRRLEVVRFFYGESTILAAYQSIINNFEATKLPSINIGAGQVYLQSHCDVCGDEVKNTLATTTTCGACQFFCDNQVMADYHAVIEHTEFLVRPAKGRRASGSIELHTIGNTLV